MGGKRYTASQRCIGRIINDISKALQFMCDQLKIVYRDLNTMVTAGRLGRDGLHLNTFGTRRSAEFIFADIGVRTSSLLHGLTSSTKSPEIVTTTAKSINIQHTGEEGKN